MTKQENLYLYTSPFTYKFEGTFWRNLVQTCELIQRSNTMLAELHEILIIVHSKRQKQWFYSYFVEQLPDCTFIPNVETLDDLMAPQETEWETPEIDYLYLSNELNKKNRIWPEKKAQYFNRKGVKKALLTFFKQSRQYQLDTSLYDRFSTHPYRDDIIALYSSFLEFKKKPAAEDKMSFLNEEAKTAYPTISHNVNNKTLFIYGFWDLPPYQATIVQTLLQSCKQCSWLIHQDPQHDIYNGSHALYSWLKNLKPGYIFKHKHISPTSQMDLFDNAKPSIKTQRLLSIEEEIRFITREIHSLLNKNTYTIDEIAIVYPNQEQYMPLFIKKFQEYEIPIRYRKTQDIAKTPLCRWLFSCLDLLIKGTEKSSLITFICDPISERLFQNESLSLPSKKALERNLNETSFRGHLSDWACYFNDQYSNSNTLPKMIAFSELSKEISSSSTYNELLNFIENTLALIDIEQYAEKLNEDDEKEQFLLDYYGLIKACFDFKTMITTMDMGHSNYYDHFKHYIGQITRDIEHKHGIETCNKSESYMLNKKKIFICGLTTDFWPGKHSDNHLILEELKKYLEWPTKQTFYNWDKFLFFSLPYHNSESISLTLPEKIESKESCPASIITQLHNYWGIKEIPHAPPLTIFCSELEYYEHYPEQLRDSLTPFNKERLIYTPNHGNLKNKEVIKLLSHQFLESSFSATQFENYQKCPYSFFLQNVLNEDDIDNDHTIPATIWGQFLHELFHDFYLKAEEKKLYFNNLEHHQELKSLLLKVGKETFDHYKKPKFEWTIKEILLFGNSKVKGLLELFWEKEAETQLPLDQRKLEHPFMISINDKQNRALQIKGKIDLVLESKHHNMFVIGDYKTGKTIPSSADIEKFRSLQLSIYQYAYQKEFQEKETSGAFIYQIHDQYRCDKHVLASTIKGKTEIFNLGRKRPFQINPEFFESLENHLIHLRDNIINGKFSPNSAELLPHMESKRSQTCSYCPYNYTCTYEHRFEGGF